MANANQNGAVLFTESVSAVTATNSVALGSVRYESGKEYTYVYNGNTEQITTGRGVRLASAATGYTVDVAVPAISTCSANVLFGVCVNATFTTATYGWICKRGFVQLENIGASSIGAGDIVHLTTSGTFRYYSAITAHGMYTMDWGAAKATEAQATTTTGSFTAYISCR